MDALPKSAQPAAEKAVQDMYKPRTANTPSRRSGHSPSSTGPGSPRRQEDHRRPGRAAGVLRLPRRTQDPPADHQPDRVHVCHRPAANEGHQGSGRPRRRPGHGLQTGRVRPATLASRERTPPGRPRPCRSALREGADHRTDRERGGMTITIEPTRAAGDTPPIPDHGSQAVHRFLQVGDEKPVPDVECSAVEQVGMALVPAAGGQVIRQPGQARTEDLLAGLGEI